ncbi:MAG TPA: penicillin-binding transpeptidase domain-containing protein, partial [Ktedonobacterales bacterium]|nr:penicillin-binding transpeptidase domain-containing protein [Ktedonobacterales bacterium]
MRGDDRELDGTSPFDDGNLGRFAYTADDADQMDEGDTPPEERTVRMPPNLLPEHQPPLRPVRVLGSGDSRRPLWLGIVAVVLVVAVIGGGVAYALHGQGGSTGKGPHGCASNTPCAVADAYLLAYTGFKFEQMYGYTSAASRQTFSDAKILRGAYKDAHDYIVNRTAAILDEAEVYSLSATPGDAVTNGPSAATVPARIVMQSTRLGTFTQDISIPLVLEGGTWHVTWTPGLIFPKLDDPTYDPTYSRLVHMVPYDAARGTVYDAAGDAIAKDDMVEQVEVTPGQIKDESALVGALSTALDMTPDEVRANYDDSRPNVTFLIRTITTQWYSSIQKTISGLPGVSIQAATGRVYPYGVALAPVTGYVGDVTQDDLKNDSSHYYEATDQIGRAGVEAWGEQYLRPTKGGKLEIVERNADGTPGQPDYTIAERAAVPGDDIRTTIDLKNQLAVMQNIAPQIDAGKAAAGGIFAADPTTGAVLIMASYPIYDPNLLSLGATKEELGRYNSNGSFLNRAIQDPRPIGSDFKIVDLAAALQNGISKDATFTCHGTYQVPGESIVRHEPEASGHGTLTAPNALAPSCDVIYWQVAIKLNSMDPNILPKMARAMGLGAVTGVVGIPAGVEDAGLVPDPAYEAKQGKTWNASFAADLAIGQGDFMATPAQVAMMSAAVGNNGTRVQPRLVSQVTSSAGAVVQTFAPKTVGTLPVSADNLATLQGAMLAAVMDPSGTSYVTWKGFPVRVAGKTGTA